MQNIRIPHGRPREPPPHGRDKQKASPTGRHRPGVTYRGDCSGPTRTAPTMTPMLQQSCRPRRVTPVGRRCSRRRNPVAYRCGAATAGVPNAARFGGRRQGRRNAEDAFAPSKRSSRTVLWRWKSSRGPRTLCQQFTVTTQRGNGRLRTPEIHQASARGAHLDRTLRWSECAGVGQAPAWVIR